MSGTVLTKNYSALPINNAEILRYSGGGNDENTIQLLNSCINMAKNEFSYKICYLEADLSISDNLCDFGVFKVSSKDLSFTLKGCDKAIIFAATVGTNIDRLIAKYSRISPAKALILQGFGTERIETLCNRFCKDFSQENNVTLTPRFSAGYGDLPLETQNEIFKILGCEKNIGITLNDSLLISPTKSVTAFVGIRKP